MLAALGMAIEDVMADRYTPRQLKNAKATAHDKGYREGWDDAKKHVRVV